MLTFDVKIVLWRVLEILVQLWTRFTLSMLFLIPHANIPHGGVKFDFMSITLLLRYVGKKLVNG